MDLAAKAAPSLTPANFSQPYFDDQDGVGGYQRAQPFVPIAEVRPDTNLAIAAALHAIERYSTPAIIWRFPKVVV